jgi:UDP-N-acetylglucosamine 1-carboxyvinyltransferase
MMAAVLAKGTTIINNAAVEPEITNLGEFLIKMGARITGLNTTTLFVEGVDQLDAVLIETIPDRIEAGTLLVAAAITNGQIILENISSKYFDSVLSKLKDSGCNILQNNNLVSLDNRDSKIQSVDISTSVFPGFPTDMQAQWTVYMSIADGVSNITDNIYLDRFKHIPELVRLGADVRVSENKVIVKGVKSLKGAKVMSTDLRASACLVLAGLVAEGTTEVLRVYHLDRGYERIEEKLRSLGADIQRVSGTEY